MSDSAGRRLYERHLDLVLAEELKVNVRLARWLAKLAFGDLPDEEFATDTSVSMWDYEVDPNSLGETDVYVEYRFANGESRRLLIEDKRDALLQPAQPQRYRDRADAATAAGRPTRAVIIAPAAYLRSRPASLQPFHLQVSIEDIAAELGRQAATLDGELADRLQWRAQILGQLASEKPRSPDAPERLALADSIAAAIPEGYQGLEVRRNSLRSKAQGWLYFRMPEELIFKFEWGLLHFYARDLRGVDPGVTPEWLMQLLPTPLPGTWHVARDRSNRNTVLEFQVDALAIDACLDHDLELLPATSVTVKAATAAIRELADWLADVARPALEGTPRAATTSAPDETTGTQGSHHNGPPDFLEAARGRLMDALIRRSGDEAVPLNWAGYHRQLTGKRGWPDIPVFVATALLARAVSSTVDPASLAPDAPTAGAYDARQLCHEVLMPALSDARLQLGARSDRPLNEPPWKAISLVDEHFPAPNRPALKQLLEVLKEAAALTEEDAQLALVAFLRGAEVKRRRR